MNFTIGRGIQVKLNSSSYNGKYALKCGWVRRYSQGKYGVELFGMNNENSSYGLYWFNENELKAIDEHHAWAYEKPITFDTDQIKSINDDINETLKGIIKKNINSIYGIPSTPKADDRFTAMYIPERILKSGNRTIIFWVDGTKTIVKCAEDDDDNVYSAFTAGLAIKMFGNNSKLKKMIKDKLEYQVKKEKKKPKESINEFEALGKEMAKLSKNMPKMGMFND